eukprot:COSAG02_NODE_20709_length_818_cov_1.108484_1_plen_27_part_01
MCSICTVVIFFANQAPGYVFFTIFVQS